MRRASWNVRKPPPPPQRPPRFVRNPNADYVPADEAPGAVEALEVAAGAHSAGLAGRAVARFAASADVPPPRAVCEAEGCGAGMSFPAVLGIHARAYPEHVPSFRFEVVRP